eukprot:Skav206522  [mRNA]  locus=scaffold5046:125369:133163:+ [translate_table: standard]
MVIPWFGSATPGLHEVSHGHPLDPRGPWLQDTTFEAVRDHLLQGRPFVVTDGARGLPMADPHCRTTVSFCFSGERKWRMMDAGAQALSTANPLRLEVYGTMNSERRSEWQPTFELTAPNGSAVVVYPGMVHDRCGWASWGAALSQERPVPAAYFRAFWPRFALVGEDVGGCAEVVEQLVVLRSAVRARPAPHPVALKAAKHFAHKARGPRGGHLGGALGVGSL